MSPEIQDRVRKVAERIIPASFYREELKHASPIKRESVEDAIMRRLGMVEMWFPSMANATIGPNDTDMRQDLRRLTRTNIKTMPQCSIAMSVIGWMPEEYDPVIFFGPKSRLARDVFPENSTILMHNQNLPVEEVHAIIHELRAIGAAIVREEILASGIEPDEQAIVLWSQFRQAGAMVSFDQFDLINSAKNDPSFEAVRRAIIANSAYGKEVLALTDIDANSNNRVIEKHYRKVTMTPPAELRAAVREHPEYLVASPEFYADLEGQRPDSHQSVLSQMSSTDGGHNIFKRQPSAEKSGKARVFGRMTFDKGEKKPVDAGMENPTM